MGVEDLSGVKVLLTSELSGGEGVSSMLLITLIFADIDAELEGWMMVPLEARFLRCERRDPREPREAELAERRIEIDGVGELLKVALANGEEGVLGSGLESLKLELMSCRAKALAMLLTLPEEPVLLCWIWALAEAEAPQVGMEIGAEPDTVTPAAAATAAPADVR